MALNSIHTKQDAKVLAYQLSPIGDLLRKRDELQSKITHLKPKLSAIDADDFDWNADEAEPTAEEKHIQALEWQLAQVKRAISNHHHGRRQFATLPCGMQVGA